MGKATVDEVLRALVAKETRVTPATLRWFVQAHGFTPSFMFEVETSGAVRRRDFDMSMHSRVTKESTASVDDLAELANALRANGFPAIELPSGYKRRPDIGQITVSVTVTGGDSQSVGLPQDSGSAAMSAIGAAFAKLLP